MIVKKLFLNAGAMKAGTTWLYSILKNHPELYFTFEKEIHFWSDYTLGSNALSYQNRMNKAKQVISSLNVGENIRGFKRVVDWYGTYLEKDLSLKWYTDLFKNNRGGKYNCDFSNLTCHMNEKGWDLVRHVAKTVKVIYIIRDPLARLWSHVKFHHQFIGKEIEFASWSEERFSEFIQKPFIWENCQYADKIAMMRKCLPADSFKLFYFEDLVSNPVVYLRKLEDFLDIGNMDYGSMELDKPINVSKKIPMPDAYKVAATRLLQPEIEKLHNLGIQSHLNWSKN